MAALRSGRMASAEMWLLHWFSCCSSEQPASAQQRKQREARRIDRSMIGEPTNFVHTGHIGSGDVGEVRLQAVQQQMSSKGGYQHCAPSGPIPNGPPAIPVGPPPMSIGPPTMSIGPPSMSIGPPSMSIGPPTMSIGPPTMSIGPPTMSIGPPTMAMNTGPSHGGMPMHNYK